MARKPARLNDTDILTDFITSGIFGDEYMETPDNSGYANDLIGFHEMSLLEAKWITKSNRVAFHFVDLPERYATLTSRNSLLALLKSIESENEGLEIEITYSSGWLLADFYFTED